MTLPTIASFKFENTDFYSVPSNKSTTLAPKLKLDPGVLGSFASLDTGITSMQDTEFDPLFGPESSPFAFTDERTLSGEQPLLLAANDYDGLLLPEGVERIVKKGDGHSPNITVTSDWPLDSGFTQAFPVRNYQNFPTKIIESTELSLSETESSQVTQSIYTFKLAPLKETKNLYVEVLPDFSSVAGTNLTNAFIVEIDTGLANTPFIRGLGDPSNFDFDNNGNPTEGSLRRITDSIFANIEYSLKDKAGNYTGMDAVMQGIRAADTTNRIKESINEPLNRALDGSL